MTAETPLRPLRKVLENLPADVEVAFGGDKLLLTSREETIAVGITTVEKLVVDSGELTPGSASELAVI